MMRRSTLVLAVMVASLGLLLGTPAKAAASREAAMVRDWLNQGSAS